MKTYKLEPMKISTAISIIATVAAICVGILTYEAYGQDGTYVAKHLDVQVTDITNDQTVIVGGQTHYRYKTNLLVTNQFDKPVCGWTVTIDSVPAEDHSEHTDDFCHMTKEPITLVAGATRNTPVYLDLRNPMLTGVTVRVLVVMFASNTAWRVNTQEGKEAFQRVVDNHPTIRRIN